MLKWHREISTYLTHNWVLRKAHFNIQMDKVSRMLKAFLVEKCFIEASLCFAKIRRDELYKKEGRNRTSSCQVVGEIIEESVSPGVVIAVVIVVGVVVVLIFERAPTGERGAFFRCARDRVATCG